MMRQPGSPRISGRISLLSFLSNRAKRACVFHNLGNFIFAPWAFKAAFVVAGFVWLNPSNPHLMAAGRALWTNYNDTLCDMGVTHGAPRGENWMANLAATLRMELLAAPLPFGAIVHSCWTDLLMS